MFKAVLLTAVLGVFAVSFLTLLTLIGLGAGDTQGGRDRDEAPVESPTPSTSTLGSFRAGPGA